MSEEQQFKASAAAVRKLKTWLLAARYNGKLGQNGYDSKPNDRLEEAVRVCNALDAKAEAGGSKEVAVDTDQQHTLFIAIKAGLGSTEYQIKNSAEHNRVHEFLFNLEEENARRFHQLLEDYNANPNHPFSNWHPGKTSEGLREAQASAGREKGGYYTATAVLRSWSRLSFTEGKSTQTILNHRVDCSTWNDLLWHLAWEAQRHSTKISEAEERWKKDWLLPCREEGLAALLEALPKDREGKLDWENSILYRDEEMRGRICANLGPEGEGGSLLSIEVEKGEKPKALFTFGRDFDRYVADRNDAYEGPPPRDASHLLEGCNSLADAILSCEKQAGDMLQKANEDKDKKEAKKAERIAKSKEKVLDALHGHKILAGNPKWAVEGKEEGAVLRLYWSSDEDLMEDEQEYSGWENAEDSICWEIQLKDSVWYGRWDVSLRGCEKDEDPVLSYDLGDPDKMEDSLGRERKMKLVDCDGETAEVDIFNTGILYDKEKVNAEELPQVVDACLAAIEDWKKKEGYEEAAGATSEV